MADIVQAFPFRSVSLQGALGVWRFKPQSVSGFVISDEGIELDFADPKQGLRAMRAFDVAGCARLRVRMTRGPRVSVDIERPDLEILPRVGALARVSLTARLVDRPKRRRRVRVL
jgi:hypothetical protein